MDQTVKTVVFWLVVVVSAFLLWQSTKSNQGQQKIPEISYSEFLSQVEAGNVSKVTISGNQVSGQCRDNSHFRVTSPSSQEGMVKALREKNVEVWFKDAAGSRGSTLANLAPLVLLAALWLLMIRQMKRKQTQPGRNTNYPT